jgi:probable HAF family extracellular repeat protein
MLIVALVACVDELVSPQPFKSPSGPSGITWTADGYVIDEIAAGPAERVFVRGISGNGDLMGVATYDFQQFRPTIWPADGSAPRLFGIHPTGESDATAINGNGDVVGHFGGALTLWPGDGSSPLTLTTLGIHSSPTAINNSRDVVGFMYADDFLARAIIWPAGGAPRDLGSAGATSYYATAINSAGDVAGVSDTPDGTRATVWLRDEPPRNLEALFGGYCEATGINDGRDVVGFCQDAAGVDHATLWAGARTPRALGSLGGESYARAINNRGTVVGSSGAEYGATAWPAGGAARALPGSVGAVALAINDAGQIGGFSFGRRTVMRWTPPVLPADDSPPEISFVRTPLPNRFGWNNTDVALSFTVDDKESGIEIATDCEPLTLKQEVAALRVVCKARNHAGLTSFVELFVSIDKTAPDLVLPANITVDATSPLGAVVSYTVTASDKLSGMVTVECTVPSGSTFPVGKTSVGCTATDHAGNPGSGSFVVTVLSALEQAEELLETLTTDPALDKAPQFANQLEKVLVNPEQACKNLDKFIASVERDGGKKIPLDLAAELIAEANTLKAAMGCP